MIKNSKELKIANEDLKEFQKALQLLQSKKGEMNPIEFKLEENASLDLIENVQNEIREFENLRDGKACMIDMNSIQDLGKLLIKVRIAYGWTQEQLGEKLGLDQQQIHRYESFNYDSIKWSRMVDIVEVLGIDIQCSKISIKEPVFQRPEEIPEENIDRVANSYFKMQSFFGTN